MAVGILSGGKNGQRQVGHLLPLKSFPIPHPVVGTAQWQHARLPSNAAALCVTMLRREGHFYLPTVTDGLLLIRCHLVLRASNAIQIHAVQHSLSAGRVSLGEDGVPLMSYGEGRVIGGRKGDEGRKSMSGNYQQNSKWSHVLRMIKSEKFELNCSLL